MDVGAMRVAVGEWLITQDGLWKPRFRLAFTGYLQVFLVAMNTVYIAQGSVLMAFSTSCGISYIWTRNVAKTAAGVEADRWFYALGAASGCISGMMIARALVGLV